MDHTVAQFPFLAFTHIVTLLRSQGCLFQVAYRHIVISSGWAIQPRHSPQSWRDGHSTFYSVTGQLQVLADVDVDAIQSMRSASRLMVGHSFLGGEASSNRSQGRWSSLVNARLPLCCEWLGGRWATSHPRCCGTTCISQESKLQKRIHLSIASRGLHLIPLFWLSAVMSQHVSWCSVNVYFPHFCHTDSCAFQ
jgi:hypothetical protein